MHCVWPLVKGGEVGAPQHGAGAGARTLLAVPPALGAGAKNRERPWVGRPGGSAARPAGRPARPRSPGPSASAYARAPRGRGDRHLGQPPEELFRGEWGAGPGVLPVGAVCGVDSPRSVGRPVVHAGALGRGDAAGLADVIKHRPCRSGQAMWQVAGCVHQASVCRGQALCPWCPCCPGAQERRWPGQRGLHSKDRRSSADRLGTSDASL